MNPLVDTNVIGELARPRPNAGVVRWAHTIQCVFLSVVTLEQISYGLALRPNPRVRAWFEGFLEDSAEVLPITHEIALRCGQVRGELASRGVTRTQADLLIAATAQVHGLTVVTRNAGHFDGAGVPVLNPFA